MITMAPRRRKQNSLRSNLYRAARLYGDIEAAEKGPGALAKREVRKYVYRKTNSLTAKLLRAFGLMR